MNLRAHKIVVFVARARARARPRPDPRPDPRPRDAAGDYEFLQLRRHGTGFLDGTWQCVRGSIESGETAPCAALRELREETGFVPVEFYRVASVETFYDAADDSVWHSAAFLAFVAPTASIALNDEHDASRWVPADEAERHFMWPSEKLLLAEIRGELLVESLCKPQLRISI